MKDINKIIDSLSPVEQNLMYNALQKKLNRGPEYTISYDKSGYYVKCDSPQLTAFRFEEEKYAELAYHIYNSVYGTGDDTAVRKIAERDFYVYKIGKIIWNNIFISDIRGHYYAPIRPNKIVPLIAYSPCIGVYRIDRGYHSYKWVALDDTYPNFRCLCLGSYDPALRESLEGYKFCCIATFIVPKGAEYFENKYGHIVSSEIIYTGKYLRISNFNK